MKREVSSSREKPAWFSVIVQVWMVIVLLLFIVVRVVGSNTGQNFLRKLGAH
jgi:uncharacterized integral membrane protein